MPIQWVLKTSVYLAGKKCLQILDSNLKIERAEGRRANFEVGPEDWCSFFARKKWFKNFEILI